MHSGSSWSRFAGSESAMAASALEENAGMWAFPPIESRQAHWLATAEDAVDVGTRESARAEGLLVPTRD